MIYAINGASYDSNYLAHYGILGMKWGVRRYQNYDGSYTQAGMKRYNKALSDYEYAKDKYKIAKKNKADKATITNKRVALRSAERSLKKHYRHLAQDKMADKGKERYSRGETITGKASMLYDIGKISSVATAGAIYARNTGMLDKKTSDYILAGSAATSAAIWIAGLLQERGNKQLRAYYSHTSNY